MNYLKEKETLLGSMLANTQAQTRLIKEDDTDGLEDLITQRQEIMTQVDRLDQQAKEAGYEVDLAATGPVKEMLGQIIALDQTNQLLMKKEIASAQQALHKIRTGRQQEEHYGTEYGIYTEEGVFFDTKE